MKNQIVIVAVLALMVSCTSKSDSKKGFEVKGVITNSPEKKIYLEGFESFLKVEMKQSLI